VIAEVALAVVLLVGSGLFLASFARLLNVDLGLDHRDVLTVRVRVLEAPADVGLAIGLVSAAGLARLVSGFLFEVQPHDPAVYAGVVGILALTGLVAGFLPARRAAAVDPLVALRME